VDVILAFTCQPTEQPLCIPETILELFELPVLFGVVNRTVVYILLTAIVVMALLFFAYRRPRVVPSKFGVAMESIVDFVRNDIAVGVIDVPDSELWADVSFVLVPPKRTDRAQRSKRGKPSSLMKTRPLAYRLEALIRVAERPEHYARRLAVRLHADPDLAFRLLRQPTPIGCQSFPRYDVGRAQAHGWLAYDTFAPDTG